MLKKADQQGRRRAFSASCLGGGSASSLSEQFGTRVGVCNGSELVVQFEFRVG
jgi:hypothetical protein